MANKMQIEASVAEAFPLEDYLQRLDIMVRHQAIPTALRAASRIVVADAKKRVPRSSKEEKQVPAAGRRTTQTVGGFAGNQDCEQA
jgi:hypothetical protein